ncbi:MAG: hypothetical protein QM398_09125 [Thermoproteota archaeon]|nr:hypothetical protein [Thermoproteota archaeon]
MCIKDNLINLTKVRKMSRKVIDCEKLSGLLKGILSKKDEIRNAHYKQLLQISIEQPDLLYSKWDYIATFLDSDNHYHRYIAITLLANLAVVDVDNKFEKIFDKYFANIDCDRTMVAGQAALNSGKIAKAKPTLQTDITNRLINIDKTHQGKHVELIKSYAIEAFNEFFMDFSDKNKILGFVELQLKSESPKTRRIATEFLKKWQNFV